MSPFIPRLRNMKYNIVAVDDHEVTLSGISTILDADGRCAVSAATATVDEACDFITAHPEATDLVLLDLRLADGSDPYYNVARFLELNVPVLIFSSLESPYLARRALQAGAAGVLQKSAPVAEVVQAITTICAGDTYASADWAAIIDSDPRLGTVDLSPRQREVLELYASGESAKRVAALTSLSTDTVQDYINRIRHKYALAGRPVRTKIDLYRRAQEDGYLPGPLES